MAVEHYVVIDAATNEASAHSQTACDKAVFDYEGEVNGVKVRTGFAMMRDTVNAYTLEEYAEITGVPVAEIERMAKEYTAHGVKASVYADGGLHRRRERVRHPHRPRGAPRAGRIEPDDRRLRARPACRTSRARARPGTT
ncbi:MAG: hypothetical protein V8S24_05875 [Gordonibacter pamelaeae]